ncbi:phosphoenolpyruvate--protein phosphotransferase [Parasphingorhabdus pacifica]
MVERHPEPPRGPAPTDSEQEAALIRPAARTISERLLTRAESLAGQPRAVVETTAAMATDSQLLSRAESYVHQHGLPAGRAVFESAAEFTQALTAAGGYLAERVPDVHDVRDRLIAEINGLPAPGIPNLSGPSVLVARDLAPADTADLDPDLVLALVTEEGGPTSHTAILARALGIPAVVAVRGLLDEHAAAACVDGTSGSVELHDAPVAVEGADRRSPAQWSGSGATSDGVPIKVLANIGSSGEARTAVESGAEGVGLFRTEFCFLSAADEPDVARQQEAYAQALEPFAGRTVVVRTLDAGADKPLPFLNAAEEPNPALGVRGLRVAFEQAGVLDRQLAAIAGAARNSGADVSVMAPMVATAGEAAWFAERARAAGIERTGVMVETPAAALNAAELLDTVDFVSIGTNDLAQYTFAADRMTGALAALNDPWQPALLRLIAMLGKAGADRGKAVGVCGEAAADPQLALVLAGLGATSLSMTAAAMPAVGSALAEHPMSTCEEAARAALSASSPEDARARVRATLDTPRAGQTARPVT